MKKNAVVFGLAAGLMVLAPVTAFATTSTSTPTSTTASPVPDPTSISLSAGRGAPGAKVKISVECDGGIYVTSPALSTVKDGFDINHVMKYDGTVNSVRPGTYDVKLRCHHYTGDFDTFASAKFVVLPPPVKAAPVKQVAKVPSGAPETGGGMD